MNKLLFAAGAALALALSACGGTSVGTACTVNDDCDDGQTCYTTTPGGYCSKGCSQEGESKECPGGTVCAAHSGTLLCSTTCQDKSDCRPEYECNGVTGSSVKVCRAKTQ